MTTEQQQRETYLRYRYNGGPIERSDKQLAHSWGGGWWLALLAEYMRPMPMSAPPS